MPSIPGALSFLEQMRGLGDRLGPIFAQLPPRYGPTLLDDLTAFLHAWPRSEAPLALEVRHPDWFKEPYTSQLTNILSELGVGSCFVRYPSYLQWIRRPTGAY